MTQIEIEKIVPKKCLYNGTNCLQCPYFGDFEDTQIICHADFDDNCDEC